MLVYNVTPIYNQIAGFEGVCQPVKDAAGNWILSQDSAIDPLLSDIKALIEQCELIEFNPVKHDI
jgi:hypothetical protein